jgi:hypothetical protein
MAAADLHIHPKQAMATRHVAAELQIGLFGAA